MRCNNCGFENANEARHCVKCNMLLDGADTKRAAPAARQETSFAGTIPDNPRPPADTIADSPQPAADTHETPGAALISCPHADCGYPYSSELKACPRCKRSAATAANHAFAETKPPSPNQSPTNQASANHTSTNQTPVNQTSTPKPNPIKGTIDPYRIKAAPEPPPPSCWLLPITKTGEKPAEAPEPVALTYTEQSIDLNRDTLEPGNTSITGKVQAQLSYTDGAWQLKDQSELQTTFLQVSTETRLKEGDIILFGDRKFIFSLENLHR
jgi:hypothetical protein